MENSEIKNPRPKGAMQESPGRKPWDLEGSEIGPEGYAIVPPKEVKIAQPVIVQYVSIPNILRYAPYCTIEGAIH